MSQLKVVEGKVIIVLSTQRPMTILIKLSGSHVLKKIHGGKREIHGEERGFKGERGSNDEWK